MCILARKLLSNNFLIPKTKRKCRGILGHYPSDPQNSADKKLGAVYLRLGTPCRGSGPKKGGSPTSSFTVRKLLLASGSFMTTFATKSGQFILSSDRTLRILFMRSWCRKNTLLQRSFFYHSLSIRLGILYFHLTVILMVF